MSNEIPKASDTSSNGFDLNRLRMSQAFDEEIGVKKLLVSVPVRKPDRQWFVRVNPDPGWRLETAVLEMKDDGRTYLVDAPLWPLLAGEVVRKVLLTATNRQGSFFVWPIRLMGTDGRLDEWSRSQLEAAHVAMKSWVRVSANMAAGAYDVYTATAELSAPVWPEQTFDELIQIAFKDRFIDTFDHPVLRRLRGEI